MGKRNKQDSFRGEALHFGSPALTLKARQACTVVRRKRSPHLAQDGNRSCRGVGSPLM